jgi:hypothetical protein
VTGADDWDEDGHQQYKDDLAMGRINEDGTQREPDEPDWDRRAKDAEEEHSWRTHGGRACDCPEPPRRTVELPHDFPRIVVLCGSTRFPGAFREANLRLTLAGQVVLSIGCDTKSDADLAAAASLGDDPAAVKARLDDLHRWKIDLADEVLVVSDAETGYFGDSTAGEIAYANAAGKPVAYMHDAAFDRADELGLTVKAPF